MARPLRLSKRRHARLYYSGQVVHVYETGIRQGEHFGRRRKRRRRRIAQKLLQQVFVRHHLLADPSHDLLMAVGAGQSEYKGTMYWNRTSFVIDPQGVLRKVYEKVNPEGHERVLLHDIGAIQAGGQIITKIENKAASSRCTQKMGSGAENPAGNLRCPE